jgi:hypothetical protein
VKTTFTQHPWLKLVPRSHAQHQSSAPQFAVVQDKSVASRAAGAVFAQICKKRVKKGARFQGKTRLLEKWSCSRLPYCLACQHTRRLRSTSKFPSSNRQVTHQHRRPRIYAVPHHVLLLHKQQRRRRRVSIPMRASSIIPENSRAASCMLIE